MWKQVILPCKFELASKIPAFKHQENTHTRQSKITLSSIQSVFFSHFALESGCGVHADTRYNLEAHLCLGKRAELMHIHITAILMRTKKVFNIYLA